MINAMALLPGFPLPEMEGPRYEALKAHIQAHGAPFPVSLDREGVVWAGRGVAIVCYDLGIEPPFQVVNDGMEAAVQELATRDLTPLEQADVVRAVYEGRSAKFALPEVGKRSELVSAWFRYRLGKDFGFSPRQVEQYLQLSRCSLGDRQKAAGARSLCQAQA